MSDEYINKSREFDEAIMLLSVGIAKIGKADSKNWYQKIKGFANALAGGNIPSLDPNISNLKSVTNIYSTPEKMNRVAESVLSAASGKYLSIFNKTMDKFYQESRSLFSLKHGSGYLIEKISDDPRLALNRELFLQLRLSDDTDGRISKDAPINIVKKILKEMSGVIHSLKSSIDKNISSLHTVSKELGRGGLPDHLEKPIIDVFREVHVLKVMLEGFTYRQPFNRKRNKTKPVEKPDSRRHDDSSAEESSDSADYDVFDYYVGRFIGSDENPVSSINSEDNIIGESDAGIHTVVFSISKRDSSEISDSEFQSINNNKGNFLEELIRVGKISFGNNNILSLFENNYKSHSFQKEGDYIIICLIELADSFKRDSYSLLSDGEKLIGLNNEDTPVDHIVKADLNGVFIKVSETATTPYYETVSPSGEKISFTPSDLVRGMGKLKDSKTGKSFKPKKVKGKSLADKVMSKNYGKVRK